MRLVYSSLGTALLAVLLLYPVLGQTSTHGAPHNFSGGPGDIGTCVVCHGGNEVNAGTGSVTVMAPAEFVPGQTYTLTVTVVNTTPGAPVPRQGFQLSVQDASGDHWGDLTVTDPVNTHYASENPAYVTHTSAGTLLSAWTMNWTAPAGEDAPETLTIYVAANAANGDGTLDGDFIYTTTVAMARQASSAEGGAVPGVLALTAVYPNPVRTAARVEVTLAQPLPVSVVLYDGLGRAVRTVEAGTLPPGPHAVSVPVAGLAAGRYVVEVRTPAGALTRAITVTP